MVLQFFTNIRSTTAPTKRSFPRRMAALVIALFCLGSSVMLWANPQAKTPSVWRLSHPTQNVHMKTPFSKVKLYHHEGFRCMGFGSGFSMLTQTCMHLTNPLAFGAEYIGMMFAVATILPKPPKRILVLGLGGAALPRLLRKFYPKASIDTVDIDPGVVQIARYFFRFSTTATVKVFVQDARTFVRSRRGNTLYDLVYVDCFDDDYIPPHLLNVEFFREVSQILSPQGILAANIFMTHKKYNETLRSWQHVFPKLWRLKGTKSGNTIVMGATKLSWSTQKLLIQRATAWAQAHNHALKPQVEMKKAKPVPALSNVRLLHEAKPFRSPTSKPTLRCKDVCCGLARNWKGTFQTVRSYDATSYQMQGRIFVQDNRCLGRFVIQWKERNQGQKAVEDFHLQFHPRSIQMDGILVKGNNYNLDNFRLSRKGNKLQGTFLHKGKPQGIIKLQP